MAESEETTLKKPNVTFLYMIFGITFVAAILMGNILASKQLDLGIGATPAGILVFPMTYIMSDIVAEVYGFKAMRKIIWIGFAFTIIQSVLMMLAAVLPAPIWFTNTKGFEMIAMQSPRILLGQILAYLCGEWLNATVISKMKFLHFQKTNSKKAFSVRAVVSTIFGEFTDSIIFIPIAFLGVNPLNTIVTTIILQATLKIAYEIIMLPFTNWFVNKVKKHENVDNVDVNISYKIIG